MTPELEIAAYSIALAFIQLLLYAVPGVGQTGLGYALSPRDEDKPLAGFPGRARRAYYNLLETLPLFLGAVFIVHLADARSDLTELGALIYFIARVLYIPTYLFGVIYVRSLVWTASMVGIALIIAQSLL